MNKIRSVHTAPVLCLAVFVLLSLVSHLDPRGGVADELLAGLVLRVAVFLLPSLIYCRLKGTEYRKKVGLKLFSVSKIPFLILTALCIFFFSVLIRYAVYPSAIGNVVAEGTRGDTPFIYAVIVSCLLPSLLEEFLFRGIILHEYRETGVFGAVLFSSILFSMVHFSVAYFPVYLFAGAVLALAYLLTGSVFACSVIHFIYNLLMLLSEYYLLDVITKAEYKVLFIFAFLCLGLLFLFLSLGSAESILRSNTVNIPTEENYIYPARESRIRSFFLAVVTPGFLACAAYFVVAAIVSLKP